MDKVAMALKSLVKETEKRTKLAEEKQELLESLCEMINLARKHLIAAESYPSVEKAVEIVRRHISGPEGKCEVWNNEY